MKMRDMRTYNGLMYLHHWSTWRYGYWWSKGGDNAPWFVVGKIFLNILLRGSEVFHHESLMSTSLDFNDSLYSRYARNLK